MHFISVLCLQAMLLWAVFKCCSSTALSFVPADVVACMFCSTHKSLTLGTGVHSKYRLNFFRSIGFEITTCLYARQFHCRDTNHSGCLQWTEGSVHTVTATAGLPPNANPTRSSSSPIDEVMDELGNLGQVRLTSNSHNTFALFCSSSKC